VTVLTCTLGELGEILVPHLSELEADKGDQLGGYRMLELERAMTALGVRDHRFLDRPGRFRDSGMMGTAGNDHPRAFWRAARDPTVFAGAVRAAAHVIRRVRPQVVVTYDPNGGYGHPDHIMTHRVAMAAVDSAADPAYATADLDPPWSVSKVYWNVQPRSALERGLHAWRRAETDFLEVDLVRDFPFLAEDSDVTAVIDASAYLGAKTAAMRAHATQITVRGDFYALSNNVGMPLTGVEYFRLAEGRTAGPFDAQGRETDLFAGVA
jgi:N-acetyl-1-D-myo-inositol-2-amino-2-deoxy-alpha-D-glucopyranoside deacetylase